MQWNKSPSGKFSVTQGSSSTLNSSVSISSNKKNGLVSKINHGIQYIRTRFGPPKIVLTEEEVEILMEQTKFSKEEILDWHKRFLEDCPNGYMTKKDFIKMYKTLFPKSDGERFARYVFRAFDLDQSSTVDFREFLLGASITSSTSSPEKKLEWTFHVFDIDKNGLLTRRECLEVIDCIVKFLFSTQMDSSSNNLEQLINRSKTSMMEMFDSLTGINGDHLTKDQFVKGCLQDEFIANLLAPETITSSTNN